MGVFVKRGRILIFRNSDINLFRAMEDTLRIHYTSKRLKGHLIQGSAWFLLAFINWMATGNTGIAIGWFLLSGLFFGSYLFDRRYGYLIAENGRIKKNTLFGRPLELARLTRIRKFAGDYILETDSMKMTINTQIIAPDSLSQLNEVLASVDLPPRLTPFGHTA
jgi:hypothetical protein